MRRMIAGIMRPVLRHMIVPVLMSASVFPCASIPFGGAALPAQQPAQQTARQPVQQPGRQPLSAVQVGIDVRPDTVTIGQHFIATIRVRAPIGATIKFPVGTATPANVDTAGSARRRDTTMADYVESTVAYSLAAWRTGPQPLGLGDVIVSTPSADRTVPLARMSVFVRSVLPADSALRVPKDPRPPIAIRVFNWLPWLIAAAILAALLIGYGIWWYWRRRRRAATVELQPLEWAEREFARIEAMQLIQRGDGELHAILMTGVLRQYLEREFSAIPSSATTRELVDPFATIPVIPLERTLRLFERTDLLKFANQRVIVDEAIGIGNENRALVRHVDAQLQAARAAEQARVESDRKASSHSEAA